MNKVKSVILIPNRKKNIPGEKISLLLSHLDEVGIIVKIFEEERDVMESFLDRVQLIEKGRVEADIAIVLGGDGSVLEAERRLRTFNIPIIGINFGHVGFLTELEESEIHRIDEVLSGNYKIEERMLLDSTVYSSDGTKKNEISVLNDIALTNGPIPKIISIELFANGFPAESINADGLIIATPTGSTAYSLSAGGPVLDPALDGICVTAICPQTLNSRPTIFSGNTELMISISNSKASSIYLSFDGTDEIVLADGEKVVIKKSEYKAKLIRIKDSGFIFKLHSKLSEKQH